MCVIVCHPVSMMMGARTQTVVHSAIVRANIVCAFLNRKLTVSLGNDRSRSTGSYSDARCYSVERLLFAESRKQVVCCSRQPPNRVTAD